MRKTFVSGSVSAFAVSSPPGSAQALTTTIVGRAQENTRGFDEAEVPNTPTDMADRLKSAAKFVTALHVASRKGPQFWRRASMIARSAGIEDATRLERALQDATTAGLVERRISHGLVKLTADGRGLGG